MSSPAWWLGATPDAGRGKDELAIGATGSFVGGGGAGDLLASQDHCRRERLHAKQ